MGKKSETNEPYWKLEKHQKKDSWRGGKVAAECRWWWWYDAAFETLQFLRIHVYIKIVYRLVCTQVSKHVKVFLSSFWSQSLFRYVLQKLLWGLFKSQAQLLHNLFFLFLVLFWFLNLCVFSLCWVLVLVLKEKRWWGRLSVDVGADCI